MSKTNISTFWNIVFDQNTRIIIPQIQRDYAQGRKSKAVTKIRSEFLDAIFTSLRDNTPIELYFIYGNYDKPGESEDIFYPLDGQQRLTMLYLLHYFAAMRAGIDEESIRPLARFGYETRHSSRVFCEKLVENLLKIGSDVKIDEFIENQAWYMSSWRHDPTIRSMLVVLRCMQEMADSSAFSSIDWNDVWHNLTSDQCLITFRFLRMNEFKLSDELFIKMNARGKPLTEFEVFKSGFTNVLPESMRGYFSRNCDTYWSDLFWELAKDSGSDDIAIDADNGFMNCFRYITSLIISRYAAEGPDAGEEESIGIDDMQESGSSAGESPDDNLYEELYRFERNAQFLFDVLDYFYSIIVKQTSYFQSLFYKDADGYCSGKVRLFTAELNLVESCARNYDASVTNNPFTLREQLLLYACIVNHLHKTSEFTDRLRNLRNLLESSVGDQLRSENFPEQLMNTKELIVTGAIKKEYNFNPYQLEEEKGKQSFLRSNPGLADAVFQLEDNHLLRGSISVIELDPITLQKNAGTFNGIFADSVDGAGYDELSCALMTFGDYAQTYRGTGRIQYGTGFDRHNSRAWRLLFTKSRDRDGFENTQKLLQTLLDQVAVLQCEGNHSAALRTILDDFANTGNGLLTWNHYYIKYGELRFIDANVGRSGVYLRPDRSNQYELYKLNSYTTRGGGKIWNPFLYTVYKLLCDRDKLNTRYILLEEYNKPLIVRCKSGAELSVKSENDCYVITPENPDAEALLLEHGMAVVHSEYRILIEQSPTGIDKEDRIERLMSFIEDFIVI